MRPAGDVSRLLLQAVGELATAERGPILRELAAHVQLSEQMASQTLKNMTRTGRVCIARTRRVEWRPRPVAEYALPLHVGDVAAAAANESMGGYAALARAWG